MQYILYKKTEDDIEIYNMIETAILMYKLMRMLHLASSRRYRDSSCSTNFHKTKSNRIEINLLGFD